jgi:hypothetical protein
MEGSDFSRSCIIGYGSRLPDADRCCCKRPIARPPGSRTRNVATCWGLRPRRIESAACDNAAPRIAFRALNSVGIRNVISWLNTQPVVSPVNAWRPPSPTDSPMTRGQCGSLHLHCAGLPPAIPCRSPGALRVITFFVRADLRPGHHAERFRKNKLSSPADPPSREALWRKGEGDPGRHVRTTTKNRPCPISAVGATPPPGSSSLRPPSRSALRRAQPGMTAIFLRASTRPDESLLRSCT